MGVISPTHPRVFPTLHSGAATATQVQSRTRLRVSHPSHSGAATDTEIYPPMTDKTYSSNSITHGIFIYFYTLDETMKLVICYAPMLKNVLQVINNYMYIHLC